MSEIAIPDDRLVGWCSSCDKLCYESEFDPATADGQEWAECPKCGDFLVTRDDEDHAKLFERIAKLEAERDALLEAITYEGAEVVNRVTAKVLAARAAGKDVGE